MSNPLSHFVNAASLDEVKRGSLDVKTCPVFNGALVASSRAAASLFPGSVKTL